MNEVYAILDALPVPAMLATRGGEVLHANPAMRAAGKPDASAGVLISLPQVGECLLVLKTVDTQTQRLASVGTLVRVLAPPVKAGISQGEASAACHGFIAAICGARNSVPHRVSTLYVHSIGFCIFCV